MCNKKSPPPDHDDPVQSTSMTHDIIKEEDEEEETLKPLARKSRTKTRKPKYLSLRSKVIPKDTKHQNQRVPNSSSSAVNKTKTKTMTVATTTRNLFPLHPENYQERGDMHDDNVALLFHSDGGATLNGLLTSTSAATTTTTSATMSSDREDQESFSTYAYYRGTQDFVRTAMRRREREVVSVEEKWVCFSELVEKKEVESAEDCLTSSTSSVHGGGDDQIIDQQCRLALKLDYQEILNAWSDKGPLYIHGDEPQTVPDLLLQDLQPFDPNGSAGNLWRVPEEDGSLKTKMEQREASVLRYKEKRQNRLFAKRIRYQVRKLNAEKRPRMKGRFVKKS